jgi:hypothetical protein
MKHTPGDHVRIKTKQELLISYKINQNGNLECDEEIFPPSMFIFCGKEMTIVNIKDNMYIMKDGKGWMFTDQMIKD